ncbi:hypothetical protein M6G53_24370 [Serratia nevei]|uniref:hypothetical protein n=1 Tax=Serratia nevei TaxID=2703794 RepID=UPI0020A141DA|nr:hypothetical protein [Serratia nevei]MCP1108505.1 hypothetical protein [Serratia nevei]
MPFPKLRQKAAWWLLPAFLGASLSHAAIRHPLTGTTAPDWTISNSSTLTAPGIDPDGNGWLRLNPLAQARVGRALQTGVAEPLTPSMPLYFEFEYASWGGNGADGLAAFLYDADQDMSGAGGGGSLGYCGGAGAYLGIGLDEFGNFSGPLRCGFDAGDPARLQHTQSVVLRGPQAASYPLVATTKYAPGIDVPTVTTRPATTTVQMQLLPMPAGGYNVTLTLVRNGTSTVVHNNVPFPYAAPASVRIGFGSATGSNTNIHEVRNVVLANVDVAKPLLTPTPAVPGSTVSYKVTFTNDSAFAIPAGNIVFDDAIPAQIVSPTWTCAGTGCPSPSGSGSIQALNGGPFAANGQVEFTVTGRLADNVSNGQVIPNTATISFDPSSLYAGPQKQATANVTAQVSTVPPTPSTVTAVPALGGTGLLLASAGLGALSARRRKERCAEKQCSN